jgi:Glycosyl hydrolases family 16
MSRHRLPDADETAELPAPRSAASSPAATDVAPPESTAGRKRAAHRLAAPPPRRRHRVERDGADTARPGRGRHGLDRPRSTRRPLPGGRRTAMVLLAVAVGVVALPTAGSAAVDQCRWQVAAHELLVSLDGQSDTRFVRLRKALGQAGVGAEIPAECTGTAAADQPLTTTPTTRPTTPSTKPAPKPTTAPTTKASAPAAPAPAAPAPSTGTGTTAAQVFGWGTPNRSDDFTAGLSQWGLYDGAGHDGNGRRTPKAISVANGIMTITGSANGDTGGMAWGQGQKYGRWEARVRSAPGDEDYHPVILLWPSAENWPVGGEVDWMEISDPARQSADTFLHYGRNNDQVQGSVKVDATQWHNWAVEWTPQGVTTFLDGKSWWSTRNTSILPPGPMHMTIQLDNFGGSGLKPSQMQVDWVRQYAL